MASGAVKYTPINGGGTAVVHSDVKSLVSFAKTRKKSAFAYAFVLAFVAFTVFLAFSPSSNSSSPLFTNIFSTSGRTSGPVADSYRSPQFSTIFSYFFPNNTAPRPESVSSDDLRQTNRSNKTVSHPPISNKADPVAKNSTTQLPSSNSADPVAKNSTFHSSISNISDPVPKTAGLRSSSASESNTVAKNGTSQSIVTSKPDPVAKNATSRSPSTNETTTGSSDAKKEASISNETKGNQNSSRNGTSHSIVTNESDPVANNATFRSPGANEATTVSSDAKKEALKPNQTTIAVDKSSTSNLTASSLSKNKSNAASDSSLSTKQETENLMESLEKCDFFDGKWIMDESYPLYKPGSCKLIDEQFNCILNGRPDKYFQKLKWKPKGCSLPRLNAAHMLEMIRGKRLAFVGDSLNRNMWESLVCILKGSIKDQSRVFEAHGRHHFRGEAEYSFVFKDYDCTVEFYVSPFLVQESESVDKNGTKKETLRLDLLGKSSEEYKGADIIIFNTGHWWTHEKTSKGQDYYQEGSHVYGELNVLEAFRKALTTWARWVDKNVNPSKSLVFFRGYSASHFSGGQWNSGGACDSETEPIKNETYLRPYPSKMRVLERVLKGMKTPVTYLNITRLTDYRKDGHPSMYRKQSLSDKERRLPSLYQDCSHWCLPGVPDSWNEIFYSELMVKLNRPSQTQRRN